MTSMTGMFFFFGFGDEVVQPVEGDCADDDRLRTAGDAILDLRDLLVELGVAAGVDQVHLDAETLGFLRHAVVDAEPVGVLHVREGHADVPRLRRLFKRRVGHVLRLAVGGEGRFDLGCVVRKPVGGLRAGRGQESNSRQQGSC